MGIRFSCHLCNQPLHVKDFQAGKRGKCPKCQGSFRVPPSDAEFSLAIDESASGISASVNTPVAPKRASAPESLTEPTVQSKSTVQTKTSVAPGTSTAQAVKRAPSVKVDKVTKPKESAGRANSPSDSSGGKPPTLSNDAVEFPASLLPFVDARWYVRPPSGGQYGPATTQTLLDWIKQRRITADSLVWREGLENWIIARDLIPEPFGGQVPSAGAVASLPTSLPDPKTSATSAPPTSQPSLSAASAPSAIPAPSAILAPQATSVPLPTAVLKKGQVANKKKQQMRQQWWILGLLSLFSIGLIVALIVVLNR